VPATTNHTPRRNALTLSVTLLGLTLLAGLVAGCLWVLMSSRPIEPGAARSAPDHSPAGNAIHTTALPR
jgi:hypothetical protein